jgi:hypothetical protein
MPVIEVTDLSNQEFLDRYSAPGRVGFAGGSTLIERTIRRMQRRFVRDPGAQPLVAHLSV